MRGTILSFVAILGLFSSGARAEGLGDVLSLQNWNGQGYQVICQDGTSETLDNIDIQLNNACPRRDPNRETGMLVIHHQEDGLFEVTCDDMSRHVVTGEEVAQAEVCLDPESLALAGVGDSHSGQRGEDGHFRIICADGSREVVTPRDIRLNNLCPKETVTDGPRTMLAMHPLDTETFQVTCADLSQVEATVADIRTGELCEPVFLAPRAGEYEVESGYDPFCRQRFVPHVENGQVSRVSVTFIGACSGTTVEMDCTDDRCGGEASGYRFGVEMMDETHYEFERLRDGKTAVFKWVDEAGAAPQFEPPMEQVPGEKPQS